MLILTSFDVNPRSGDVRRNQDGEWEVKRVWNSSL